jgi:hypothetical protein
MSLFETSSTRVILGSSELISDLGNGLVSGAIKSPTHSIRQIDATIIKSGAANQNIHHHMLNDNSISDSA